MTVVVENGTGIASANSYVTPEYVTAYLTARDRATENGWTSPESTEEQAAVIEATSYIESRFGMLFAGYKEFRYVNLARATLFLNSLPTADDTVTIGSTTYTFKAAVGAANTVLIADTVAETIDNLVAAVVATSSLEGTSFGTGTTANADATALAFYDDQLAVYAKTSGTAGNAVATTETLTDTASVFNFATLVGGSNRAQAQPLSFPRLGLYDRDGYEVLGIPERLKHAAAEYAVRARLSTTTLSPDPTTDSRGGSVVAVKEAVGPIVSEVQYLPGTTSTSSPTLPAYPAADRLLSEYLRPQGVVRG